jgi:CheY-like chemotaxis protein
MMALGHPVEGTPAPTPQNYVVKEAATRRFILLVEDNPVNQKVAATKLEKRGHRVVVASNGKEALEVLNEENFDIVLMDVQMPEMDGFEATERIRQKEKEEGSGHIPIVALTAQAMKGDREKCLAAGMDDYVSKPIRDKDLFSAIENLTDRFRNERKEGPSPSEDVESPVEDIFDLSKAMNAVDGDRALFEEAAKMFLKDAGDKLANLREGLLRADASGVEKAVHNLKRSVDHFGAKRALDAVSRLERIGKNGTWPEAETAQLELEREIKALEDAVKRALAS